jgi:hypothetical protein
MVLAVSDLADAGRFRLAALRRALAVSEPAAFAAIAAVAHSPSLMCFYNGGRLIHTPTVEAPILAYVEVLQRFRSFFQSVQPVSRLQYTRNMDECGRARARRELAPGW